MSEPPKTCEHCGGTLLIVRGGLFCEHRCDGSRSIPIPAGYAKDHPELIVKTQPHQLQKFGEAIEYAEATDRGETK